MPALHVRDIDDALIAALEERARRNGRSLQEEVRAILEAAVVQDGDHGNRGRARRRLRLRTVRIGKPAAFSRDTIYEDTNR